MLIVNKKCYIFFSMNTEAGICKTIESAFELLGKKWTGQIIHVLMDGDRHFCDLTRALPALSDRMLSLRMRELEEAGIVIREVSDSAPVRVIYRLTPKGKALKPMLDSISDWAYAWVDKPLGVG